jgi:exopolysaccharide biosynthesis polyprenyl glycosylphosphotransferase
MLLATVAFGGTRYPLHLSGVARFVFDLLMPAAGISLAIVVAAAWGIPLSPGDMLVPLLGAWFVTFVGGWLEEAFNAHRPVRLAVIAEPRLARTFAREMEAAGVSDHCVVGWISESSEPGDGRDDRRTSDLLGIEWLGSADQIRNAVVTHQIDLLVMAPRGAAQDLFKETVERCVDLSVRMVQASYLYEEMYGRVPIGAINEAWFAYIMHPNFSSQAEWSKRLGDGIASMALLLLLSPVFAAVALAVKFGDGGSVFFRQRRVGAHGREFDVLKFRTMSADAETAGEARWASADDERVTPVGRLLRKSHLDEIPQLFNVVAGSMSLVGPRPERPEFVAGLEKKIPYYSRRVLVKPGITGWAQVSAGYAGSEVGTAFKLCHDLYYIKHRSFLFDLLTMIETMRTVVADKQYQQFDLAETFVLGDIEVAAAPGALERRPGEDAEVIA